MSELRKEIEAIYWTKSEEASAGLYKHFSREESAKRGAELTKLRQEVEFLYLIHGWDLDVRMEWLNKQNP